ncbi:MAG: Gfo/Idh/MocA family oxidoreductase [Phycisphaerae bacterium]|nr:Gfo/Idh/MocA family oxidoreductase [Phycisphaerae bacterium]
MENNKMNSKSISRRTFIKTTAAVSIGTMAVPAAQVFAAGSDELKVGLVGCGGRGTGAATQALMSTKTPVKLWAMADVFRDKLDSCYGLLANGGKGRYDREDTPSLLEQMNVPEDRKFTGFDACRKVIESGVDIVILATPPNFRAQQFKACVEANKHVFMEKPAAVDPAGIRIMIEASKLAEKKGLSVVAGTQRRHQNHYIEIMKRIHDGAIGEIRAAQCYWNGWGASLTRPKPADMSDVEWQIRTWYHWLWLCGDHIVEQHVHNLDIMNWALQGHPVQCLGMGGRQVRTGGNIFDHFIIEFEYPNGVKVASFCHQMAGVGNRVSEHIVGTKGRAYIDSASGYITGPNAFKPGDSPNPYLQEHADLIHSIRSGKPINDGLAVSESTLCGIMGRMSAYTGRALKWDWALKASKLDLSLEKYELGPLPVAPVPVPGQTPLV